LRKRLNWYCKKEANDGRGGIWHGDFEVDRRALGFRRGIMAIIGAIGMVIAALIGRGGKRGKKAMQPFVKESERRLGYIIAGGDIKAGGDIIVGGTKIDQSGSSENLVAVGGDANAPINTTTQGFGGGHPQVNAVRERLAALDAQRFTP
jgi:hypothetical protein